MLLVALNVGMPAIISNEGEERPVESGIVKKPVQGAVWLGKEQLDGDGQADRIHHGGPDKAVCVYCAEHYPFWQQRLQKELSSGAFGENFTSSGWTEEQVHIGDVFSVGTARVQVSQPRQPCFKLAKRHEVKDMVLQVQETGYTGYYFRVLEPGEVEAGQELKLVERHPLGVSVAEANRLMYKGKEDAEGMQRLLAVEALSESWRSVFEKRLSELSGEKSS